jgi:DNA-directed RNA polymerase specialized sigma24 family protein
MSETDASLQRIVADLQAGRAVEESFRLLCDRFHRPLYRFFARRGFSDADCLDLTQETGMRAGEEVPLSPGPGVEDDRPVFQPVAEGPLPGASLLQAERARLLREEVHMLPDQMRKCLILNVYHELKVRQIAQLLHLSPETVKVHLFQARRRLRKALGPHFPGSREASS